MPRFNTSSGRQNIVSLKKKKKSLADTVNEQLTLSALGGGGGDAEGTYQNDDEHAVGGVAEDYEYDEADSDDLGGDDDAKLGGRGRSATYAALKPTSGPAKPVSSSSRLRHRGPLDASLSEGKYAATPVSVEAAMDDIFGALDMGNIEAEGEEFYDDEDGEKDAVSDGAEDMDAAGEEDGLRDDVGVRGGRSASSKKSAVSRKRRRAKDLTEEEYTAWLEKKHSALKKAGQFQRPLSFGGGGDDNVVLSSEEADILRQLSELRQTQMSLMPSVGTAAAVDAGGYGMSSAVAAASAVQCDAQQTRDAVQHFIMVYSQLLRLRVLMQPAVTKAISMPQYYAHSLFVDGDAQVDDAAAAASNADGAADVQQMREDVSRHYSELQGDVEQVLCTLYAAATGSGSASNGSAAHESSSKSKLKKAKKESAPTAPSYREVERYHARVLRHADACLQYWGSKLVQANSAKLKTIAQPLPQQIAGILSAKSRLRSKVQKNRSHIPIIAHPEHILAVTSPDFKAKRAMHIAEGDVDNEIYDDADFLRELVRRGGAVASQLMRKTDEIQKALLPSHEGARKGFHRMTKGKAVNYEPRQKLVAFMMPEPFDDAQRNDVVVKNLFQ
ncbi:hypothetical protein JKF63_05959 [Porcisia hertigi]|uniref:AATF leucine zipper-containing domain-containing protein n=1 Tax=Porcisia hertigi TaxID=2761500 RepID=A0A836IU49_9TRYP|nr:hypothetical protein JKF63_05959 [Porcisia hertigi]